GGDAGLEARLRAALRRRLPDHMVPADFMVLAALPLTAHGKLDRKRLAAMAAAAAAAEATVATAGQATPAGEGLGFVPPGTPAEELLAGIWRQVLGKGRVGVHDNFFDLGGDSILSLQVVSRAARAGWRITPRQVFERPTVAALAAVASPAGAGADAAPPLIAAPVAGEELPLSPAQCWFFEQAAADPHHFNQSVLLRPIVPLAAAVVARAWKEVVGRHPALRLRFIPAVAAGGPAWRAWRQVQGGPDAAAPFARLDLSRLPPGAAAQVFAAAAAAIQGSLDLTVGPLARAAWFDLPAAGARAVAGEAPPARLLLVAHHLVVDGVSWRVIAGDLDAACRAVAAGQAPALPPPSAAFAPWSRLLAARAVQPAAVLAAEGAWWLRQAGEPAARLPLDHPAGRNLAGSLRVTVAELSAAETRALLEDLPAAWRAHAQDGLLAALVAVLGGEERALRVEIEGHGREDLSGELDLTGAVGWFTSLQPVRLALPAGAGPGAALQAIKEQLRAVPGKGLGYGLLRYLREAPDDPVAARLRTLPAAEVRFNYLGQLDQTLLYGAAWAPAPEAAGPAQSPRAVRSHLLDLVARVSGGRLRLDWMYSAELHDAATIEGWAAAWLARLRSLLAESSARRARGECGYTPSDFPLARLAQPDVDRLLGGRAGIADLYPVSPLQHGLLFHSVASPGSGAYVEHLLCTLRGDLDADALADCWEEAVARHPILRTAFVGLDLPRPLQAVAARAGAAVSREDWRPLPPAERRQRLEERFAAACRQGFDLERAPLARWALWRTGDREHQLLWSYHHLLIDGWSFAELVAELAESYEARRAGRPPRRRARRPFRDFLEWLERQDSTDTAEYWRRTLAGFTAPTPLGLVPPPAASGHTPAAAIVERLGGADTAALGAAARRARVTLNTLVQAAWALLLARYSGEPEVVFGITVAGRPPRLAGVETMLGLFINTLPLRAACDGAEAPVPWLQRLQAGQGELRDHEHTPLARVQGWSEVPPGTPLFESVLVFENYPRDASLLRLGASLGMAEVRLVERTHYPLALAAVPGERLLLRLDYDPGRCDRTAAARLPGHLASLLAALAGAVAAVSGSAAADTAAVRLADLLLLAGAERHQLLYEWSGEAGCRGAGRAPRAAGGDPRDPEAGAGACLDELFGAWAARAPHRPALACGDAALSYGELDRLAGKLAARLAALGAAPEVLVAVCLPRSLDLVVALLAVLRCGAAYVPLDPDYPPERLAFVLADSGARLLLARSQLAATLAEAAGDGAARYRLVACDDLCPPLPEPSAAGAAGDGPTPAGGPHLAGRRDPRHLAYVIYTSGSTGRPKGVPVSHANVGRLLAAARPRFAFGADDVWTLFHSPAFDFSVWEIWGALAAGGRLVIVPLAVSRDPEAFARLLAAERVTVLNQTPSAFAQLAAHLAAGVPQGPAALPALRWVIFGGEALEPALLRGWLPAPTDRVDPSTRRPRLVNMYGITETTVHVTWRQLGPEDLAAAPAAAPTATTTTAAAGAASPIGRPLAGLTVDLLDAAGRLVPAGVPGEIHVGGAGLARGYLGRPALTAARFVPDPWSGRRAAPGSRLYRSGDLARRLPDGQLEFLGRADQQVKIRGFRIELGEIEAALLAHPEVAAAAVTVREPAPGDRRLAAAVVPCRTPGGDAGLEARLRAALRRRLPDHMVPADFMVLAALPLTAHGKLDRKRLA
ncbi:MAG TPA: amino acid adenylation domain-containing protein, partial [Thermoanaerobaculia bacterium]|nr:amino acid adenylation domain-containing protein [Thermoanaerobaculia bacterium]